jgi:hypothetical protein
MKRVAVHALALVMGLALGACAPDPRDEIRERISKDMKVAGALAEDFVALGEDAGAVADEQARATEEFETRYGTVEDAIANECLELQQSLTTLKEIQRAPSEGESRTDEELASIQAEIERVATRLQETCGR